MTAHDEAACHGRAEEVLQIFKKGAEFTQELLRENERLRYRVLQLESCGAHDAADYLPENRFQELTRRVEELEQEKQEILGRIRLVEQENHDFANRYLDIEAENNNLANLYVASYQLHSTLDFKEVLQIITEIVINLIGAEEFAIMLLDEKTGELQAVASEGVNRLQITAAEASSGVLGQVIASGESYFVADMTSHESTLDSPLVCIPLKIKDHVIGVLAIYRLLIQKKKFAQVDYELFTLLAGQAATAIFGSRLYSDSERRLSTIQGFLDLLTK